MKNLPWLFLSLIFLTIVTSSAWVALAQIKSDSLLSIKHSLQTVTKTSHEALHIWIRQRKNDLIRIGQDKAILAYTLQLLEIHHTKG